MVLMWGIVLVLAAAVIAGQIAFLRSTAGLTSSRAATAIRAVNLMLLLVALALALYASLVAGRAGGM